MSETSGSRTGIPIPTKIAFGIGASGEAATNWIFNALVFFYYNQILGLSGTLTAAAVTIGIASDAVTDPLIGSISDRWRSRRASTPSHQRCLSRIHVRPRVCSTGSRRRSAP